MNIKIQGGGGGVYANSGSCVGVVNYLTHEELERVRNGLKDEPFFTYNKDKVSAKEVTYKIDNNKAKLCKKDSKFFVITVSPSEEEIQAMGTTEEERSTNFKEYINKRVMQLYAQNFGKDLRAKDLMYYGKIHHTRGNKEGEQMHAHIIVSRKDLSNSIKLSPQTNHRKTGKNGTVKGGFDRTNFFMKSEKAFDLLFDYKRDFKHSFEYQNAIKNGTLKEIKTVVEKNFQIKQEEKQTQRLHQQQSQEQRKSRGMRR